MREAHPDERAVGVAWYVSDADGTGGSLRREPDAFRVRELERTGLAPVDAPVGDYRHLVCRVRLRGWDTNDFAARLSDALGISRERVSWAGTKDKRATTTQLVSLDRVDAADLANVAIRDADVEPVGRLGRPLLFGDLAGNAFEIRVHEPDAPGNAATVSDELAALGVEPAGPGPGVDTDPDGEPTADDVDHVAGVGVPNYFGHQRFGSRRPVTHVVGRRVLRGDWRGAVLAYVGNPAEGEPEETRAARARVEAAVEAADTGGDAGSGSSGGDAGTGEDPDAGPVDADGVDWGALVESYPGYLRHERAMLHRLADGTGWRTALEAVPENLQRLFVNAAQSEAFNRIVGERLSRGLPLDRPVAGDVVCFADRGDDVPDGLHAPDPDRTQRVTADRVDTVARHCERGRAFVTAPLVGTDTDLAGGEPGDVERTVLGRMGVEPADFDLPGAFESTGTRRAVLVRTTVTVRRDPLRFGFALPSGSYATALLREYLKAPPSAL